MDGVAICVENYAKWMQKMVGGVSVITPSASGADYSRYDFEVLDYFSVPVPFRKPYVAGIGEVDPTFLAKIVKRPFKIVHAHSPFVAGRIASHVASLRNIPLVATFHSKYREDFSRVIPSDMLVNQAIKLVVEFYERADEVWVPQESVIDVLREYGFKGPVEVVANGSDLVADYPDAFFADARAQLGVAPDEFALLFVGQHIWEKNVRMIIDALEKLQDLRFRMFFVGTGYAASEMKKLVSEKGLEDRVTFAGIVKDREQLKRYYAASDLFLFPSLYDTDGIVVKEAAALHSPSVMLETATAASVLTDDVNGFVVPDDLDAFTGRIRSLAGDPERVRRVGLQASRSLVRSWEDVVGEVMDRYNRLIAKKFMILVKK
ncbi:MAG: glycosyltransferase [Bacteroidales bacterium]|nr:glycosyltransferase [Bacteroidales bacterium]